MRFSKMQGIGNDFIIINCFEEDVPDPSRLAIQMCRTHYGVGADGLVLLEPADGADVSMRIFNADGSESEMCGNALRCIGKYMYERGMTDQKQLSVLTRGGIHELWMTVEEGVVTFVRADMGSPELSPRHIPVDLPGEIVLKHRLQMMGQTMFITCVNMGNPHTVIFVRDPEVIDLPVLGPMIEHHPLFPRRTNVEFVRVIKRDVLQMRVWERGAGETLTCGTGACAALVAGVLTGSCDRSVQMKLAGGNLGLQWNAADNHVYMSGEANFVFDGIWEERV